jgi:putative NIF3 family GTP cyclohydrolase 1 type 2
MDSQILHNLLDPGFLEAHPDEWGVTLHHPKPDTLGFATTLTPAVIRQAAARKIDLLVTHHDAWEFMLEERQACLDLLAKSRISHIWCHAPLDAADFGTAAALLDLFGCRLIRTIAEGDGRVGALPAPLPLAQVIQVLDEQLGESPCRLCDADRPVTRMACVTGAGGSIAYVTEALDFGADLYVTGETSLYLLEYAGFRNINALIYSHNYTEILGTQNLAHRIAAQLGITEIIQLDEPHY